MAFAQICFYEGYLKGIILYLKVNIFTRDQRLAVAGQGITILQEYDSNIGVLVDSLQSYAGPCRRLLTPAGARHSVSSVADHL